MTLSGTDLRNREFLKFREVGSQATIGSTAVAVSLYGISGGTWYPITATSGANGGALNVTASVSTGSESYIPAGSVIVTNMVAGSIVYMPSISTGSVSYIPAGSVIVTNMVAGSIVYMPSISTGSETYIPAGSVIITNNPTIQYNAEAFGYSGASFSASGTATNIWTPGAGSNAQLKGFTISAQAANAVRILFSGGAVIGQWTIPGSGTVGMNMLGMEPSGASNQPIAVGLLAGGSVDVSIFARSIK